MKISELISAIKSLGLEPAAQREVSLFFMAQVITGYTSEMRKRFGFSYHAVAVQGNKDEMTDYMNVIALSLGIDRYLHLFSSPDEAFSPLRKEFSVFEEKTNEAGACLDPFLAISLLLQFTPSYYAVLGFYNAYWRYLDTMKIPLSHDLEPIAKERNNLAFFYPLQQKAMITSVMKIGGQLGFEGLLLMMATVPEMKDFLETRHLTPQLAMELKKRQEQYFYLYVEDGPEVVITDKKEIAKIQKECFPEQEISGAEVLHGQGAYPGKMQGKVILLRNGLNDISVGSIVVAHSTHPKDLPILKKAAAIVAEEGGVLSHAAIIARELKIPTVIGVKGATKVFKEGEKVEVEGIEGTVRKIS